MTRSDEPAFPSGVHPDDRASGDGLTKRELFAAMAMQGTVANPQSIQAAIEALGEDPRFKGFEAIARVSVRMADALLAELEKERA